ncbi:DJ-1/PfpI family protein [Salinifilum ghardaiensis]
MRIAIALFDRFAPLDAVGPYEVLHRIDGVDVVLTAEQPGPVRDNAGTLALTADAAFTDVPAPDVVLVPGGPGQREHMADGPLHRWLRTADATSTYTTGVCTGTLVLAAAGLLSGRRAATHWLGREHLTTWGATAADERVVADGKYLTAAGVSAGIDMALTLAGRLAGDAAAQRIQLGIEYDPHPPHAAGSPRTAPAELVADLRSTSRFHTGQS